jgi:hypothetical protein
MTIASHAQAAYPGLRPGRRGSQDLELPRRVEAHRSAELESFELGRTEDFKSGAGRYSPGLTRL